MYRTRNLWVLHCCSSHVFSCGSGMNSAQWTLISFKGMVLLCVPSVFVTLCVCVCVCVCVLMRAYMRVSERGRGEERLMRVWGGIIIFDCFYLMADFLSL